MPFPYFRHGRSADDKGESNSAPVDHGEVTVGNLHYVVGKAGNDSPPAYQEASGAPVETKSPFGYAVGAVTIVFLNLSKMIGTGIYSTPASILKGTGSIGTSMLYWFFGYIISLSSLAVYLEYASYFPNRSGSEVAYLEQAYPRPRYFFPVAFAVQTVILSFSSGNAIVLAKYLFATNGHVPTNWELKGVAIASYTVAVLLLAFHTRFSYRLSNAIGIVKLLTLVFIAITGLVVLGGNTKVADPQVNFRNSFHGTPTAYGATNALYKIVFSYAGYENAFNVVNEVKNPVKKLKINATIALTIVAILYVMANVAYFAAAPKAEIIAAKEISAGLLFHHVFGSGRASKGLNFLIALSSFGNLIAVLLGQSRLIRECGRQGVLPFPRFWASTRPFGTPLGPYFVKWILTVIMIVGPPAGDAFNFVVDLQVYPASLFNVTLAVGIYIIRWRRKRLNLERSSFRAWDVAVVFNIAVNLFLIVMPWYPPSTGRYGGDVSFWYATYVVTGIGILVLCGIYYVSWIYLVPKWRGYRIRQEVLVLEDGAQSHRLVKVPVAELEQWDATHNAVGNILRSETSSDTKEREEVFVGTKEA
ncbi:LAT family L-amino acid transporter [Aaosphaeria arxii CBS 175.79]|uniref:LAT family L-amino acid transporter n=1 Tax=Aaosphaeria arxii CBS 175.79 TaxID=1450172 RepID=A0A6A5XKW4_9PLEO|nr:LAT family L-amino acid transporter [Aaosphaeria arxii CBS 175.79]KAF2013583.1 LAT family L-amino acid transporter [Aaosphaeria arxii CBS 175.79]